MTIDDLATGTNDLVDGKIVLAPPEDMSKLFYGLGALTSGAFAVCGGGLWAFQHYANQIMIEDGIPIDDGTAYLLLGSKILAGCCGVFSAFAGLGSYGAGVMVKDMKTTIDTQAKTIDQQIKTLFSDEIKTRRLWYDALVSVEVNESQYDEKRDIGTVRLTTVRNNPNGPEESSFFCPYTSRPYEMENTILQSMQKGVTIRLSKLL